MLSRTGNSSSSSSGSSGSSSRRRTREGKHGATRNKQNVGQRWIKSHTNAGPEILSQPAIGSDRTASSPSSASPLVHGGLAVLGQAIESYNTTTSITGTEILLPSPPSLWNFDTRSKHRQQGSRDVSLVQENHSQTTNQIDARPRPLPRQTTAVTSTATPKEAAAFHHAPTTTVSAMQAAGTRDGSTSPLVQPELGGGVAMVGSGIPSPRAPAFATDARIERADSDQNGVREALVVAGIDDCDLLLPRSLSPTAGRVKKKRRLTTRERTEQAGVVEPLQAGEDATCSNQLGKVTTDVVTGEEEVNKGDVVVERDVRVEDGYSVGACTNLSSTQPRSSSSPKKKTPSSRNKLQLHPPNFDVYEAKRGRGKIRRRYSIDFKVKVAKYALSSDPNGKAKGGTVGPRYAAANLGIPEAQSVREWIRRLPDMERALAQAKTRRGSCGSEHVRTKMSVSLGRIPVTHSIEAQLLRFIQESEAKAGQGVPVHSRLVKDKAQELLPGVFGRPPPRDNLAAVKQHERKMSSWCHRFLKRNGVISVFENPLKRRKFGGGVAVVAPSRLAIGKPGSLAGPSTRGGGVITSSPVQSRKPSVVASPAVAMDTSTSLHEPAVSSTTSKQNVNSTAGAPAAGASPAAACPTGVASQAILPFSYSDVLQEVTPSPAHLVWQVPPLGPTSAALRPTTVAPALASDGGLSAAQGSRQQTL